jgi:hypothetical protein
MMMNVAVMAVVLLGQITRLLVFFFMTIMMAAALQPNIAPAR